MARILITGGCGFIGSHVSDLLIEEGHGVHVLDNLSTGKLENLNPKADFISGDIRKLIGINYEYDYVFHLASLARIQPSIEDPLESNDVNVNGTLQVLEYCRKSKAKLIFSGSSSIFKGDKLPTGEGANRHPANPYSLQKYICEEYIKLYHQLYGLRYTILRYFNVYGERQVLDGAYAAVVGIFLEQRKKGQSLTTTNDGEQRRDFTYVKDVAQANLMAMDWSGIYNIGSGINYSINQLADWVGGDKKYIGDRIGEVKETLCDNRKAYSKGWKPTNDIRKWISENIS